jgi:hypothetical protein
VHYKNVFVVCRILSTDLFKSYLIILVDLTSLSDIISVFEEQETTDSLNRNLDVIEILDYLQKIFEKTSNDYPQLINVILTVDLTLNWLLNIYDT